MRNLTIDYNYTAGTRAITVAGEPFTVENIRLIVNETQKKVLCSSMQKDLIVSVVNNVITYSNALPALVAGDKLTIELDNGVLPIFSANAELAEGKALIAENLTTMGVTASGNESLTSLGNKVLSAGLNVTVGADPNMYNYPSDWHDLFAVMASVYDVSKPYMYALLLNKYTPQATLDTFVGGEVVVTGGQADADKNTMWVVFKRSAQNFSASYAVSYANYILGIAVFNANIDNVIFNGSRPAFLFYNDGFNIPINYNSNQFYGTKIMDLVIPTVPVTFNGNSFQTSTLSWVYFKAGQTEMTISGINTWQNCSSLTTFTFPQSLTSLTISAQYTWYNCTSLTTFTFPQSLTSLTISGGSTWQGCSSLTTFTLPQNLTSLTISGGNTWTSCISLTTLSFPNCRDYFSCVGLGASLGSLTTIILGAGWKWTFNTSNSTVQSHDSIVANFAALIDKRADGINPTTVTSATNSPIITGVNSQFTKVFVGGIGQTISIDGGANLTILSVDSDTQLTLTTNSNKTGSGLNYNINKTLTLGATNLARVSAAEIAVATNKGWQIN